MSACVKCGFDLVGNEPECPRCGVITAKARPRLSEPVTITEPFPDGNRPEPGAQTSKIVQRAAARGKVVSGLLVLGLVLDAAAILSGVSQHSLLTRAASGTVITDDEATSNDAVYGGIGIAQMALFAITGLSWLLWLSASYKAVLSVGARSARFTAGWAVGYWFVPVVNLWRPYQIVKDLWLRSDNANSRAVLDTESAPSLIGIWWAAYLAAAVSGRVLLQQSRHATTISELQNLTVAGMANDALTLLAAVFALMVVQGVVKRQKQWHQVVQPALVVQPA